MFTVLNFKERYLKIRIKEQDRHKITFSINGQKHGFSIMPMGFKNNTQIHQQIMNKELNQYSGQGVQVYLDDIIIYNKN